MPKTLNLILLVIFFGRAGVSGQERNITGLVTAGEARQSGAIILNKNSTAHTLSNDIGEFLIRGKTGDILMITKDGYEKDTLPIAATPYLVIRLRKNPLMLKEVDINSTLLTPEKILTENKTAYKEIYRKGDKSNMVVITPLGVGVVIDKVWSAVSKEGADARRLQRTFNADYENSIIDKRFTKKLVTEITGYNGDRLFDFMSRYRPSYKMVKNATDYELIQYIKRCITANKIKTRVKK